KKNDSGAQGDTAFYTYSEFHDTATEKKIKWNSWSFWVGNLEQAGQYTVWAYIPNYVVEGNTITSEANYRVWYKGRVYIG
ncbi:MAG: hypothetical protein HYV41_01165, partial [Candidatus Magasanikbacteria bacterium]|nr:hypothetical protein [Candidatus Magasanikbacteria bacterium]